MMKFSLAAIAFLAFAGGAMADPLEGLWRTAQDDNGNSGLIEVAPCGAALCGTLVKSFNSSGAEWASPNIGRQIIWDTMPDGEGKYRGRIYSPDRDKEYGMRATLTGDQLQVKGCVLGICREGGVWSRSN